MHTTPDKRFIIRVLRRVIFPYIPLQNTPKPASIVGFTEQLPAKHVKHSKLPQMREHLAVLFNDIDR